MGWTVGGLLSECLYSTKLFLFSQVRALSQALACPIVLVQAEGDDIEFHPNEMENEKPLVITCA